MAHDAGAEILQEHRFSDYDARNMLIKIKHDGKIKIIK